ncbi:MAG: hypothetical protein KA297_16660 [Kofleriaceae bacterium]|nr:hypothetical protein [Kofleriaceae bacterium]
MRAPVVVAALTCALAVAAIAPARAEVLEPPPPAPTAVADFTAQAKLLFRVAACGGTEPVPAPFDAKIVDAHCAEMQKRFVRFRQRYVEPAQALLATVRPAGLPTRVVYPFGGGDLVSALVVYPDAREVTTISLEHVGDPTRLAELDRRQLRASLSLFREVVRGLLVNNDSASENMRKLERGAVPGQLSFFLTGLAVLGYEPVGLRYFVLDGESPRYLTNADVASLAKSRAKRKKGSWVDTDFSEAFTHAELSFRRAGDATAPVLVHRHFAANLADDGFVGSALQQHLVAKGKVAAMTKAASYLLWLGSFSGIRDYLMGHLAWMLSDSTGIPPRFARKAGLVQTPYGRFTGSYLPAGQGDNDAFRALWARPPRRPLRFRFGYPDAAGNVHMLVTAPAPAPASPPTP